MRRPPIPAVTAPIPTGEPKFYVVLLPDIGKSETYEFSQKENGLRFLQKCLRDRQKGAFKGEILPFWGRVIFYKDPRLEFTIQLDSEILTPVVGAEESMAFPEIIKPDAPGSSKTGEDTIVEKKSLDEGTKS